MARTYAVRVGGSQGPVAHTRGLYSSAAVTDGGVVGSSSVTMAERVGLTGGIGLSSVAGPSLVGVYSDTYAANYE